MSSGRRWLRATNTSFVLEFADSPTTVSPPVASIRVVSVNKLVVQFDGTASFSTAATISGYSWTFGDGQTSTAGTPNHTYAAAGTYTVNLSVTDSTGGTASTSVPVVVTSAVIPPVPVAQFTVSQNGLTVTADGSASSELNGSIVSWAWLWGDSTGGTVLPPTAKLQASANGLDVSYTTTGSTSSDNTAITYDVDWGDGTAHSTLASNTHTYSTGKSWVITLRVTDSHNQTATATATVTTVVPASGGGGGGTRIAVNQPFASSAWVNTAIGSNAVFDSDTAATTQDFGGGSPTVNWDRWSVAVNIAKSSDPIVTISGVSETHAFLPTIKAPIPLGICGGSDRWTVIIQPDGHNAQEISGGSVAQSSNGNLTASHATTCDLYGNGQQTAGGQTKASKTSDLAGVIRQYDINQGAIRHALQVSVASAHLKSGFVWPALSQDGFSSSYSGSIPMGSLFAIPPSVNINSLGLSSTGLMLAKALQDYGCYVLAQSSSLALAYELSGNSATASALRSAWSVLYTKVRRVSNNSSTNVGGGGTPRQPALPALQ